MRLLTGPAGSGKTTRVLDELRAALRRREAGVQLLTPIATMAQHLQNRLAREGFVFRPAMISTLSRFVEAFAADLPQASEPLLYLLVEETALRVNCTEFAAVVRLPGFCAALARTMEEFSSAGCHAASLAANMARVSANAPLAEPFLTVYTEVERELARRGFATRSQRLLHAAERIQSEGCGGLRTVWLDGFYALPDPELAVIDAIRRHAEVTLTLPEAPITLPTRERLRAMGFVEEGCSFSAPRPRTELCETPSTEREADEIARRILDEAARGRPFREIGVVVRSPEWYEPILRSTFDRFGIPARFYFDSDLSQHALIRGLTGIVDAMLGGWDYAETLAAVRQAPGMDSDEFDFQVKEAMPGRGIGGMRSLAGDSAAGSFLAAVSGIDSWRTGSRPPAEWAELLKGLRATFTPAQPGPAEIARSQAEALDLCGAAMDEAAKALPAPSVQFRDFWRAAKSVLRLTPLRPSDARRNIVHVLGAHEARQWRLPVVFVCGLVEKQFPKFHSQDPFFPEAARAQLKQAGVRIRTAADFDAEERFLFDWAVTRATDVLTLTYPRTDARGQQNLPSLYLESVQAASTEWRAVRPRPAEPLAGEADRAVIASPDLLEILAARHAIFSPTALESYLQCPFQFLGRQTLDLKPAPLRPEQRLDYKLQGNIVHRTLATLTDSAKIEEIFDAIFERVCAAERVPDCYRTAALRERMRDDLRRLVGDPEFRLGYETRVEQKFQFALADGVEIKGRIDRMEVAPGGAAYVIDYKYSGAQNTRNLEFNVNLLQPQIYMLALERHFGMRPEGMSYWGFKGGLRRIPWIHFKPEPAIETTLRIAAEIRAGFAEARPADKDKCRLCDYRDVCRVESAAAEEAEGAAAWD